MTRIIVGLTLLWSGIHLVRTQPQPRHVILYMPANSRAGGPAPSRFGDVCTIHGRVVDSAWACAPPASDIDEVLELKGEN